MQHRGHTKIYQGKYPCSNKQPIPNISQIILHYRSIMLATHMALLNLNPILTQAACTYHISPHLQSGELISIGQRCNDGCIEKFSATHINVVKDGIKILVGNRSTTSGMWQVNLTNNPNCPPRKKQPVALNALSERINTDLAKWYQAALFSTVKKAVLQAIKNGHFTTWHNLTL